MAEMTPLTPPDSVPCNILLIFINWNQAQHLSPIYPIYSNGFTALTLTDELMNSRASNKGRLSVMTETVMEDRQV